MINLITGTNNFGQYLNINHFSKTKFNSTLATSSFNKTKKFYPHFNTINLPKIYKSKKYKTSRNKKNSKFQFMIITELIREHQRNKKK